MCNAQTMLPFHVHILYVTSASKKNTLAHWLTYFTYPANIQDIEKKLM